MRTVVIDKPASAAAMYLRVLASSRKRPRAGLSMVTYVRPQVLLEADHIARYASICGFEQAHGVPITYPQLLTFPLLMAFMGSADCPWPAMGMVHLANSIRQRQALRPGDALRVELRTGQLFAHQKGQVFTLEMKILRGAESVWEATQSLLRLGVAAPAGPPYGGGLNTATDLARQADLVAAADIGRRYGKVSGDLNPIHLSALSARLFGFRRAIAHGMWTKARALAILMPRRSVSQARAEVEFKTPLYLPASASLWTARDAQGSRFEVRDARGDKPHLRGHLSVEQT